TSTVAATSTSASPAASAASHRSERTRARGSSPCAATLTKRRGSQRGPHDLRLEICLETLVAVLAAEARSLEAAERRAGVDGTPRVHVHRARAQGPRQPVGARHVARPHAGGKAIFGVVGASRDLLERVIRRHHKPGTEDLI